MAQFRMPQELAIQLIEELEEHHSAIETEKNLPFHLKVKIITIYK